MAGSSLLTLIDDIATVLDDVAILSKVAMKKTAGVLGDDLALNAEQVSGVKAEREIPVVWAVAKGSFLNKFIIVPAALLISAFFPPLIPILLIIGGLFLCFEGAEKIAEKYLHSSEEKEQEHKDMLAALSDSSVDLVEFERQKIKGAIRTDFILSAEIIVIGLGTVQGESLQTQVMVLSSLAILMTVGVYGLVAAIVKLDDLGLYLLRKSVSGSYNGIQRALGRALLIIAPKMMKFLTIIGTIAMFLVGGGLLVHNFAWLHHIVTGIVAWLTELTGSYTSAVAPFILDGVTGLIAGGILLVIFTLISKMRKS